MNGAHPYRGVSASFATKHEKEKIVAPIFFTLGISLQVPDIDTDLLGTFSGEIDIPETTDKSACQMPLPKVDKYILLAASLISISDTITLGISTLILTQVFCVSSNWYTPTSQAAIKLLPLGRLLMQFTGRLGKL